MNAKQIVAIPSVEEAVHYAPEQVVDLCRDLASTREQRDQMKHQLEWFKRQLFGQKSERRLREVSSAQMSLGELGTDAQADVEPKKQVIAQHTRKVATRGADDGAESVLFFDETPIKAGQGQPGKLKAAKKLAYRLEHAKPIVERFFAWVNQKFEAHGLLPSNPLTKALAYARDRRDALEVFLTDAEVPIDTNHLERALRPVPMGRKNWMFCWTEFGARQVGIVQSLIATCRLHGTDPYDYLVDVPQRVGTHPATRVTELIPRNWKYRFASQPMRLALHGLVAK